MNVFDITAIEDGVREIVKNLGVSKKVYVNRPKEADPASDFVVVSLNSSVEDLSAYGRCAITISLFARDVDSFKNGKKLSVMYQKLAQGFPAEKDNMLFDTEWTVLGDTPDDFGFHARIIRINTILKAI
jgi:hypothetical protein